MQRGDDRFQTGGTTHDVNQSTAGTPINRQRQTVVGAVFTGRQGGWIGQRKLARLNGPDGVQHA